MLVISQSTTPIEAELDYKTHAPPEPLLAWKRENLSNTVANGTTNLVVNLNSLGKLMNGSNGSSARDTFSDRISWIAKVKFLEGKTPPPISAGARPEYQPPAAARAKPRATVMQLPLRLPRPALRETPR